MLWYFLEWSIKWDYTTTWKISAIWFFSVKLRINRSTLKDIVSLHQTAPNWINYILHRKTKYNKSNILRLATQYSLNLFVKRYNAIVNKHCWIIKHPCRLRINLCRSREVLPCKTRNKKIVEHNSMGKHLCRQHLQRQCSGFSWVLLKSVSNWLYTSTAIDSLLHSRF